MPRNPLLTGEVLIEYLSEIQFNNLFTVSQYCQSSTPPDFNPHNVNVPNLVLWATTNLRFGITVINCPPQPVAE